MSSNKSSSSRSRSEDLPVPIDHLLPSLRPWARKRRASPAGLGPTNKVQITAHPYTPHAAGLKAVSVDARWHPYHSRGDITLKSEDGMLFGADSWRLAKASATFANMLDIPQPNASGAIDQTKQAVGSNGAKPIDMGISSHVLNIFLNLINVSDPFIPDISFPRAIKLLDFLEKFECDVTLIKLVKRKMSDATSAASSWDRLVYASTTNNLELAKEALSTMGSHGFTRVELEDAKTPPDEQLLTTKTFRIRMKMLPKHWQGELFMNALIDTVRYSGLWTEEAFLHSCTFRVRDDWQKVVKEFDP